MGLRDSAEIEKQFDHILRDTVSARMSPDDFQMPIRRTKDNIKTVIRFND
jgi:hypothetical protein